MKYQLNDLVINVIYVSFDSQLNLSKLSDDFHTLNYFKLPIHQSPSLSVFILIKTNPTSKVLNCVENVELLFTSSGKLFVWVLFLI